MHIKRARQLKNIPCNCYCRFGNSEHRGSSALPSLLSSDSQGWVLGFVVGTTSHWSGWLLLVIATAHTAGGSAHTNLIASQPTWQCTSWASLSDTELCLPKKKKKKLRASLLATSKVLSFPAENSGSRVRLQKGWQSFSRAEVGNSRDSSSTPISRDRWMQIGNNFCGKPSSSALKSFILHRMVLYTAWLLTTWEGSLWIFGRISQCTNWHLDSYFHNPRNINILPHFYFTF